jgi:hypothetical protein
MVGGDNQVNNRRGNGNTYRRRTKATATHTGHTARTGKRKAIAAIMEAQRTCQTCDRMRKTPSMDRARLEYKTAPQWTS